MNRYAPLFLAALLCLASSSWAQPLYSVAFSVGGSGDGSIVHISDVTAETADATRDSVLAAYTQQLEKSQAQRASLFVEKAAKFFTTQAAAQQFRADLIENSKAAGKTVELFAPATPAAISDAAPKTPDPADTAWPFPAADAKRRQLAAAQSPGLKLEMRAAGRDFVLIPAGEFVMGSPADEAGRQGDESVHRVRISTPFYLAREDETLPATTTAGLAQWLNQLQASAPAGYAFRLPTEAEWEYAARAGKSTAYHTGAELYGALHADKTFRGKYEYRNCAGKSVEPVDGITEDSPSRYRLEGTTLHRVGQIVAYRGCDENDKAIFNLRVARKSPPGDARKFQPNAWGLYDIAGRYDELVADKYGPYASGSAVQSDPLQTVGDKHVVRGGNSTNPATDLRLARRGQVGADSLTGDPKFDTLGMRLVLFKLPD